MYKQLSMAVTLCAAASGFSTAQAQVACGDIITTFEVLTGNLNCSGFDPALTIQGPGGRLNMRRFTLSCEGSGALGILMTGSGPRLQNGTVANCAAGVDPDGSRAQVSRMILRDNDLLGLVLNTGSGHRVSDTNANNNGTFGFVIIGGNGGNFLNRNRAVNNGDIGFVDFDDVGDRYTRNVATSNGGPGFGITGGNNTLTGNTASQNSEEGFHIIGDNNTLTNNIARSNFGDGIEAESGALNNTLSGNTASGNGFGDGDGDGGFDLEDDNTDCDNNAWTNNTGTRNQACVD